MFFHFSPPDYTQRKVCLIGPASSVLADMKGVELAGFDHIICINRAIETPLMLNDGNPLRFDTYVRNIVGNRKGELAGHYTEDRLSALGVENVVLIWGKWKDFHRLARHLLHLRAYKKRPKVYIIPPNRVKRISKHLNNARPSTGFAILATLCEAKLSKLHVAGFTFFQTAYVSGYNDNISNDSAAIAKMKAYAEKGKPWTHRPVREKEAAKLMFRQCSDANCELSLGRGVLKAMETELEE